MSDSSNDQQGQQIPHPPPPPALKVGGKRQPNKMPGQNVESKEISNITPSGAVAIDKLFGAHKDVTSAAQFDALQKENPTLEKPSKAVASTYFPTPKNHLAFTGDIRDHNLLHDQKIQQPRR